MEEISLTVDPSEDKVLGVFGNKVYIKTRLTIFREEDMTDEDAVVITSKREYLKMWQNWLEGKRDYCERWEEFCGVMGEFEAEEYVELEPSVHLNDWEDDGTENGKYIKTRPRLFRVKKFDDFPQFEHG